MFMNREKCNICSQKLHHHTLCHDPYFYVYKCDCCGYYVSLREIQKYLENITSPIIDKNLLEQFKINNPQYDYNYSVFLIGNRDEIEQAKNNKFEKYLQCGQFHFDNVIYLNSEGDIYEKN